MKQPRSFLLIGTGLVALGIAGGVLLGPTVRAGLVESADAMPAPNASHSSPGARPTDSGKRQAGGPAGPVVFGAPGASAKHVPALPPEGAPVAQLYKEFSAVALAGAAKPACRIAADLQRCQQSAQTLRAATMLSQQASAQRNAQAIDGLLRNSEQAARVCDGVTDAMVDDAYRHQAVAAQHGGPAQQRWLAANPALDSQNFLRNLDAWRDYRRRAEQYFTQALAARRVEDLGILLAVYAPDDVMMPRPPYRVSDPVTFLALYEAAQRHNVPSFPGVGNAARDLMQNLTPAQQQQLSQRRAQVGAQWSGTANPGAAMGYMVPPPAQEICS